MTEKNNLTTHEERLREDLENNPDVKVGYIMNNKYRVMDVEENFNIFIILGNYLKKEKDIPLIMVPGKKRNEDENPVTIKFKKNQSLETNTDDGVVIFHAMLLAKSALEKIVRWRETPKDMELPFEEYLLDEISDLGPRGLKDNPYTDSARTMLEVIDNEIGEDL